MDLTTEILMLMNLNDEYMTLYEITEQVSGDYDEVEDILEQLVDEGVLDKDGDYYGRG